MEMNGIISHLSSSYCSCISGIQSASFCIDRVISPHRKTLFQKEKDFMVEYSFRKTQEGSNSLEFMNFSHKYICVVLVHWYFSFYPCLINRCYEFISVFSYCMNVIILTFFSCLLIVVNFLAGPIKI